MFWLGSYLFPLLSFVVHLTVELIVPSLLLVDFLPNQEDGINPFHSPVD